MTHKYPPIRRLAALTACFFCSASFAVASESPPGAGLGKDERMVVNSRMSIHSGIVKVVLRDRGKAGDATTRLEIYFDDGKTRADRYQPATAAEPILQCILTKEVFVRAAPGSPVQLFGPKTRPQAADEIPDPHRLGLVVWFFDTINQGGLEDILLRSDRDELTVKPGMADGAAVDKVNFKYKNPAGIVSAEYWLAPGNGNLPVFISVASGDGPARYVQSIRNKLANYNGVWYPTEVVFSSTKGGQIERDEVATVEHATFGQPISARTFTLAGLGLANGRTVVADGKVMSWDGGKLVPLTKDQFQEAAPVPSSVRFWVLLVNAFVLALIAAALLRRRWSSQPAGAPTAKPAKGS